MDLGTLTSDQGCFPFDQRSFAPAVLLPRTLIPGIRSLIGSTRFLPIRPIQCSTPRGYSRRYAKTYFGENQLLPSSISFSLLPPGHPMESHDQPVRASSRISATFTLPMGSSLGFGSHTCHESRYSHSVSLCFGPFTDLSCDIYELVGSFFNRHAMAVLRPL